MMRRQEMGRRYLAGLVIAFAAIYLLATCVITVMAWRYTYPLWLLTNWVAVGLVPSLVALALAVRAWSADTPALSVVALVVLLVAITVWQLFVVTF